MSGLLFSGSYCLVYNRFYLTVPFHFTPCDFLSLAGAFRSIYLLSVAAELTFISIIAVFLSPIYFLSSTSLLCNEFSYLFIFFGSHIFFSLNVSEKTMQLIY